MTQNTDNKQKPELERIVDLERMGTSGAAVDIVARLLALPEPPSIGIACFIITFFRHGRPTDEVLGNDPADNPAYQSS
mgnify:CR=1 FL=1